MAEEKVETSAKNETVEAPKSVETKVSRGEERQAEIASIGERLASYPEVSDTESQRKSDFKREVAEAEASIGQTLSEQSKQQIYDNMVSDITGHEGRMREGQEQLETDKTILEYVQETLGEENEKSFIKRPMQKDCRVAVMIPAYNESHQNILRSLSSLAEQRGISPSSFEVDVIVNNRKKDVEQQTEAFLANQQSLQLIDYINGKMDRAPEGLTEEQEKQIEAIRQSQIRVNAIDKSSPETANEENNVGIARNRAGAEIADRFMMADARREGVIAITDCDCIFSDNYIKSLIQDFGEHRINGLSGNLEFELDPNLTENRDLIQQAFDIYMGRKRNAEDAEKYKDEPNFKPEKNNVLRSGANMAVPVRSWAVAGGMPKLSGGEDIRFGRMVEGLEGTCAKDYGYTITSLIRVSERTGMQGNGRIVKKIKESVDASVDGKTDGIFIEDRGKVDTFFGGVIEAGKNGSLTGEQIMELMRGCDFKKNRVSEKSYDELARKINAELTRPEQEWNVKGLEEMISERIYPYYPERDITAEVKKELLTPEAGIQKLFGLMDKMEDDKQIDKPVFIDEIGSLLRVISKINTPDAYKIFRQDEHFKRLKIPSQYFIRNSTDRDLHKRIFSFLAGAGMQISDKDMERVREYFDEKDARQKMETMHSYAQNGLLTIKSAIKKGVLKETSATPGDFETLEDFLHDDESSSNIRGYELADQDINDEQFYGRNGFFRVVSERGGEDTDQAGKIDKIEAENRFRSSMIFVVKSDKLNVSRRTENKNHEDIVGRDINPDEIDYILVDESNVALASKAFESSAAKIIGVKQTAADIEHFFDGPYNVPNYKDAIAEIVKKDKSIWCHIARLPVDTYPKQ